MAVSRATSFAQVAYHCLTVLRTMPRPISQLCGPISTGGLGSVEKNVLVFGRCIEKLRLEGLNPFDQIPMEPVIWDLVDRWREQGGEGYCHPILDEIYGPIFGSGMVSQTFFLPLWETSTGTRWERQRVTELGIEVHEFPRDWYESILEELELAQAA